MKDGEITKMLKACSAGNRDAMDKLVPLVYDELRHRAHRHLQHERHNHSLQTTGLVHEAYLRLIDQRFVDWQSRAHFFGIAATMMRRILVNYAIERNRQKRGGPEVNITFDEALCDETESPGVSLLELDEVLNKLAEFDKRQVQIIELRYFSGLTIKETAEVMQISPATVKREWKIARAWLRAELKCAE